MTKAHLCSVDLFLLSVHSGSAVVNPGLQIRHLLPILCLLCCLYRGTQYIIFDCNYRRPHNGTVLVILQRTNYHVDNEVDQHAVHGMKYLQLDGMTDSWHHHLVYGVPLAMVGRAL